MSTGAGLALALLSAVALNWGWIAQHGAARDLPSLSPRRPVRALRVLFGNLSWLTGFAVGLAGWAFYVAALVLAPLSLVQAASAGGIGILAALAHRRGDRVGRTHWLAVGLAVVGLLLLGVSLEGGAASGHPADARAVALWLVVSAVIAALAGVSRLRLAPGAGLGIAAGLLYGAGDVATKGAVFGGAWLLLVPVVLRGSRRRVRCAPARIPARWIARDRGDGIAADERAPDRRGARALPRALAGRGARRHARRRVRLRRRRGRAARPQRARCGPSRTRSSPQRDPRPGGRGARGRGRCLTDPRKGAVMQVITASRASIHAPDGAAALALEHRLAHLHPTASHNGRQWLVRAEGVEDLPELEASIRGWLREIGVPETFVDIDGRELRVGASMFEGRRVRGSNENFIG